MDIKKLTENVDQEQLKKTLEKSLKVLETAGDPIVVDEAKKIEGVLDQIVALNNKENKDKVEDHLNSMKAFDQGLVAKYGLVTARIIEFVVVALIGIKYLYLG